MNTETKTQAASFWSDTGGWVVPLKHALALEEKLAESDLALDKALKERDETEGIADVLAWKIAEITGKDIGEHSSANCPWLAAIEASDEYTDERDQLRQQLAELKEECDSIHTGYIAHGYALQSLRNEVGLIHEGESYSEIADEFSKLRDRLAEAQSEVLQMAYAMAGMKEQLAAAMKCVDALRDVLHHGTPIPSGPMGEPRPYEANFAEAINSLAELDSLTKDQTK